MTEIRSILSPPIRLTLLVTSHLVAQSALLTLVLLLIGSGAAAAQTETPEKTIASESNAVAAVEQLPGSGAGAESKPTFLLPDVVVEGEDLSRLTGGIRLLDTDVPGVVPRQQPLVVGPAASRYLPRTALPFDFSTPVAKARREQSGWWRLGVEQEMGLSLAGAWLPGLSRRTLLWCDLERSDKRLPGLEQFDGVAGFLQVDDRENPVRKLGGMVKHIDSNQTPGLMNGLNSGEIRQSLLSGQAFIEGLSKIGGWPGVRGIYLNGGATTSDFTRQNGKDDSNWFGSALRFTSRQSSANLYDPKTVCTEIDMTVGLLSSSGSDLSTELDIRVNGFAGRSFYHNDFRYALGIGAVGDTDENQIGPWVYWRWTPRERSRQLYAEVAPAVLFADDLAMGRNFYPNLNRTTGSFHPGYEPQVPAGRATLPFGARFNPQLSPQIAWPRLFCRFRSDQEQSWFQLTGEFAQLADPISWRQTAPNSRNACFEPVSLEQRFAGYLQAELNRSIGRDLNLYVTYLWSYDAESDSAEALAFLALHQAAAYLTGQSGQWLWGGGVRFQGNSSSITVADQTPGKIDSWLSLTGFLGWRFGTGQLMLRGENLLDDDVLIQPGVGYQEPRLQIAWEQTF